MFFRKGGRVIRRSSYQNKAYPESQDNDNKTQKKNRGRALTRRKNIGLTALPTIKDNKMKLCEGSLSLEAAVVIPLFLMIVAAFLSFFGIMMTQLKLQTGMERVGREIAGAYYAADKIRKDPEKGKSWLLSLGEGLLLTAVSEGAVKDLVRKQAGDFADEMHVRGGENGVSFLGTRFSEEKQEVILQASYEFTPFFLPVKGILLTQASVHRAFTGKTWEKKTEEPLVYVTTYGKVYHTSLSCNYLDLSIITVDKALVGARRNVDGSKYYECEVCEDNGQLRVFITSYGDRFHYDRNCSGLKRSITSVPVSQVGSRHLCKKCEKRESP